MKKACEARIANPTLTLLAALKIGGFTFPQDNPTCEDCDDDGVRLRQRKNQLSVSQVKKAYLYRVLIHCSCHPQSEAFELGLVFVDLYPLPLRIFCFYMCVVDFQRMSCHPDFVAYTCDFLLLFPFNSQRRIRREKRANEDSSDNDDGGDDEVKGSAGGSSSKKKKRKQKSAASSNKAKKAKKASSGKKRKKAVTGSKPRNKSPGTTTKEKMKKTIGPEARRRPRPSSCSLPAGVRLVGDLVAMPDPGQAPTTMKPTCPTFREVSTSRSPQAVLQLTAVAVWSPPRPFPPSFRSSSCSRSSSRSRCCSCSRTWRRRRPLVNSSSYSYSSSNF